MEREEGAKEAELREEDAKERQEGRKVGVEEEESEKEEASGNRETGAQEGREREERRRAGCKKTRFGASRDRKRGRDVVTEDIDERREEDEDEVEVEDEDDKVEVEREKKKREESGRVKCSRAVFLRLDESVKRDTSRLAV